MSEYDCVGVTSEYLESLKNKIAELEQQKAELIEFIKEINESSHPKYICNQHWIYLKTREFLKKHGVEI